VKSPQSFARPVLEYPPLGFRLGPWVAKWCEVNRSAAVTSKRALSLSQTLGPVVDAEVPGQTVTVVGLRVGS
jgi:hypothetical protein